MFDPMDDPLGLGLKQRMRNTRMNQWATNPALAGLQSPLGEDWDAWFQTVEDSAGGKPVKFEAGEAPAPDSHQLVGFRPNELIGEGTHAENMLEQADPMSRLAQVSQRRRLLRTQDKKAGY